MHCQLYVIILSCRSHTYLPCEQAYSTHRNVDWYCTRD